MIPSLTEDMKLTGKTVLVTGASSGIGRAAALRCAQLGASVAITGRDSTRLAETERQLAAACCASITQDLACPEGLDSFFQTIVSRTGKLDGLIHCAGIPGVIPLRALTRSRLEEVMAVDFYSFVELVRQFGKKRYSRDGGSIIGISAVLARRPRPYELAYISAKAALEAAVAVMAMELKDRKIRVNCVSPGAVKTEMLERLSEELGNHDFLERTAQTSLSGWQSPEEIARICAFLICDASSSINAKNIQADGGWI